MLTLWTRLALYCSTNILYIKYLNTTETFSSIQDKMFRTILPHFFSAWCSPNHVPKSEACYKRWRFLWGMLRTASIWKRRFWILRGIVRQDFTILTPLQVSDVQCFFTIIIFMTEISLKIENCSRREYEELYWSEQVYRESK